MKNQFFLLALCTLFAFVGTSFKNDGKTKLQTDYSKFNSCGFTVSPNTIYTNVVAEFATPDTYGHIKLTFTCPNSSSIWSTEILGTISGSGCIPSATRVITITQSNGRKWTVTIDNYGNVYVKNIYDFGGNNPSPYETVYLDPINYPL